MLYTSEQIRSFDINQHRDAVERYLHKFSRPKEFCHLKLHEKDYLFRWMKLRKDDSDNLFYNMYKMSEAAEFMFNEIILTYGEDVDSFSRAFYGPFGKLSAKQVRKDQRFFNEYLHLWKNQVQMCKGPYLVVIKPLLRNKLKELKIICMPEQEYRNREKYFYASFFWIYYRAKLYFEEKGQSFLLFKVQQYSFVANIYSFCHILSRHYIPSMNVGLSTTINSDIPCIDINNFLESIKNMVLIYFEKDPYIDNDKQYLLYKINGERYILWIKYKNLNELSHKKGFEIRSFYRCERIDDVSKFDGAKDVEFADGCYCCIKKML